MDLRDYLRILSRRWLLIAACALLGVGVAALVTLRTTPVYEAKTQVFITAADTSSSVGSAYTGSLFSQQLVSSYLAVASSLPVAQAVVDDLGLPMTAEQLSAKVTATVPQDSVVITLTASDRSPQLAQEIATSLATQFGRQVSEIQRPENGGASLVKVNVVEQAELPKTPASPRPKLNLALGLLVGLALGVGLAVLRETLDTRVKTVGELAEVGDLPTLGVLVRDSDVPKHPLVTSGPLAAPRAEAFRQLRTNLQYADVDRRPRSYVVTSAVAREGKTTVAANLALTLAQTGERVVLLEGDLRRPRLAALLGVEGSAGLTDVLAGRADLPDVIQPYGADDLWVLTAGSLPPNPSELLGSQAMADLLAALEERALVVIDAPPLLPVTDAAVLTTIAGGALLVVAVGKTRREQVRQAEANVANVGGRLLGAVANLVPARGLDAYGGAYAGAYGYAGVVAADTMTAAVGGRRGSAAGEAARTVVPRDA